MYNTSIKTSRHKWEKKNLVTINRQGKMFDEMVCEYCKMKGRRYGFENVEVAETYKAENAFRCKNAKEIIKPKRIQITRFTGHGRIFANLIDNSIHDVINAPAGYKEDALGVWVIGVGEPVKLLTSEYKEL